MTRSVVLSAAAVAFLAACTAAQTTSSTQGSAHESAAAYPSGMPAVGSMRAPWEEKSAARKEAQPQDQSKDQRDCFDVHAVSGFSTVDDDTVRVEVGPTRAYEIDATGASCTNLRRANQIALEASPSSPMLCVGDAIPSGKIHTDQGDECVIRTIRRADTPPFVGAGETAAELTPPPVAPRSSGMSAAGMP